MICTLSMLQCSIGTLLTRWSVMNANENHSQLGLSEGWCRCLQRTLQRTLQRPSKEPSHCYILLQLIASKWLTRPSSGVYLSHHQHFKGLQCHTTITPQQLSGKSHASSQSSSRWLVSPCSHLSVSCLLIAVKIQSINPRPRPYLRE